MVFQNKPNVVKYFLLFITFLLSLNLFSNANAIEKRKNVYNRYPSSLEWKYNSTDQTANFYKNSFIRNVSLSAPALQNSLMQVMKINLLDNITLSQTKYFHLYIIFFSSSEYQNTTFNSALCPRGNNVIVDKCELRDINLQIALNTIQQYPDPNNASMFYGGFSDTATSYQLMELWGHYNSTNDTTLSQLTFHNPFYIVYSSSSVLPANINLTMYFSPIEQFEYVENASDEAAEKEMESTTNIENQTPQNSSGGSSENQQTTNLIGVFSGFLTQLQSFSATNCNLDLPFPAFIGGTQTVNICQGKDVLGNFITIVGTLAMLTFYIPLAFVLLKMIYNEIRSFTNG